MNDNQPVETPARHQNRRRLLRGIPDTTDDVLVSVEDLRPISPREHAVARDIAAQVRNLIDYRQTALESSLLDPEIDMPAGNWGTGESRQ